MPVYLFTYHAYQSWMPDRSRGYVKNKTILPCDPVMAEHYRRAATQAPNEFDDHQQIILLSGIYDACARRRWRLHCFGSEPTHVHVIVSWKDVTPWRDVRAKLKNLSSLFLGRAAGVRGRKWFGGEASRRRVRDREHLRYLMDEYLPRHSGLFWREGDAPPPDIEQMVEQHRSNT